MPRCRRAAQKSPDDRHAERRDRFLDALDFDALDTGRLRAVRQPTLVLWGERDRWIPPAHAAEFAARIPDVTLHRYAGLGHVPMEEDPQRVAADLLNCDWENVVIERGDTRRGLPFNSPQAGSLSASTQSRTNYVAAMDRKGKLRDIAAQMLGGKADADAIGLE